MTEVAPFEKTKDVTIEGRKFQLGLLPALTGNWVLSMILTGNITDEAIFNKAQAYCFEVCKVYREPEPGNLIAKTIYRRGDSVWLAPELEYDLETINALWDAVTEFNFGSFLAKRTAKLEAMKAVLKDSSQSVSRTE